MTDRNEAKSLIYRGGIQLFGNDVSRDKLTVWVERVAAMPLEGEPLNLEYDPPARPAKTAERYAAELREVGLLD